jgi:hypothetical protein
MLNIAIRDLRCGDATTICARGAINLIFHFLRNRFEAPLYEIMPPQPGPKSPVLLTVLLPVALNLYEVC